MPEVSIKITGLSQMIRKFKQAPKILDEEIGKAMSKSIGLIQRNVRMKTPVDTGRLRTSIGGTYGWRWIRQRMAGIGTNVKYALWVEVRKARHPTGTSGYFQKGVKASLTGITKFFELAMRRTAQKLTR